jgi:hypothetical protein
MNHSFNIHIAKKYGLEEAIMIGNFQHWITKNIANERHLYEGRTWTYNSVKAYAVLYPYWTEKQVRRILDSLVSKGVLLKGSFNKNPYLRTAWYSFVDESLFLYGHNDLPKWANGEDQSGSSITDIKPNEKQFIDNTADVSGSIPTNQGTDNPNEMKKGGGGQAALDYKGMDDSVKLWLEYKAERKQKYSGQKSIQIMINQLYKKANGSPERAMSIVENSIANNYQGLFEARENNMTAQQTPVSKPMHNVKFNIQ